MSEFSRTVDLRQLALQPVHLEATSDECAALAARFGLVAVSRLVADLTLEQDHDSVRARGRFAAEVVQSCAVSAEDLPVRIAETLDLRFIAAGSGQPGEEVELEADALDEIEFSGTTIDLGEAVAQSLALAIDPFLEGPDAERVRAELLADRGASGPFAALAGLKKPN